MFRISPILAAALVLATLPVVEAAGCAPQDSVFLTLQPTKGFTIGQLEVHLQPIYVNLDGTVHIESNGHDGLQRVAGVCRSASTPAPYEADTNLLP